MQSLSGTGSLRVGAAFIAKFMPGAKVFLPSPTWGNHKNIFADAGVEWDEYAYYDAETIGLDLEGMLEAISSGRAEGSVFVLHGCAHNPTGVDPTMEEWEKIADAMARNRTSRFSTSRTRASPAGRSRRTPRASDCSRRRASSSSARSRTARTSACTPSAWARSTRW